MSSLEQSNGDIFEDMEDMWNEGRTIKQAFMLFLTNYVDDDSVTILYKSNAVNLPPFVRLQVEFELVGGGSYWRGINKVQLTVNSTIRQVDIRINDSVFRFKYNLKYIGAFKLACAQAFTVYLNTLKMNIELFLKWSKGDSNVEAGKKGDRAKDES